VDYTTGSLRLRLEWAPTWRAKAMTETLFNICHRRVGGIWFLKIGRLTFAFSISQEFKPFKERV